MKFEEILPSSGGSRRKRLRPRSDALAVSEPDARDLTMDDIRASFTQEEEVDDVLWRDKTQPSFNPDVPTLETATKSTINVMVSGRRKTGGPIIGAAEPSTAFSEERSVLQRTVSTELRRGASRNRLNRSLDSVDADVDDDWCANE